MANLLKVKEMLSFTAWKTVYQLEPLQKSNGSFFAMLNYKKASKTFSRCWLCPN